MSTTLSHYQQRITETLIREGLMAEGLTARHVEAWMRIEHGTLDHLSGSRMDAEVRIAAEVATLSGPSESEALAQSFGL